LAEDGDTAAQLRTLLLRRGPNVLLIGPQVAAFTEPWPAELGVVHLLTRVRSAAAGQITVATCPLRQHDLLAKLALACGRLRAEDVAQQGFPMRPLPRPVAPTAQHARSSGQLVLLAEDNEVNRDILQEQLRLLGYAAEAAADGVIALAMWRSGRYALLLTDCHMPNLDGFGLTAAIRQAEAPGQRLTIVAVTANALAGEAQRCLDRGMDDYLGKPLRLQALAAMMHKWLPLPADPTATPGVAPRHVAESGTLAVWDARVLIEVVGEQPAMHRVLLEKFLHNARAQVRAMGGAHACADLGELADLAHTLKSSSRSVGALWLGELCEMLEQAGSADDAASCSVLLQGLAPGLANAAQAITLFLETTRTTA
jgi:CheY-like chemotaxis protein/HPt (histidine-containing phosphotransfer) domain-containing protein